MSSNILILSYYYPPCTGVAAYRPLSWAKDFHQHGYHPTILSRHWNGKENNWADYLKENKQKVSVSSEENARIIRLPYKQHLLIKLAENRWSRLFMISKLIYFWMAIVGKIHAEVDAEGCFEKYLDQHLQTEKYAFLVVTSPPLNIIRLAYKMNKKHKIPYVVDFRDSWNNLLLGEKYKPSVKENFYNNLKEYYLKKWLKKSTFLITVTPAIEQLLAKISSKPVEIITNGFQLEAYRHSNSKPSTSVFTVSVIGTIHPMQDISMMLSGLNLFLKNKDPNTVRINFVGLESSPEMAVLVRNSLPSNFITISPRVTKKEAIALTLEANILLFPSYKGYKDYFTAKIFEYIGAERNILMVPGNHDLVDALLIKTKTGKIAYSEMEFNLIMEEWLTEWKETGTLLYHGKKEEITYYSRENQTALLCKKFDFYFTNLV